MVVCQKSHLPKELDMRIDRSKAQSQRVHARKRLQQRYGLDYNRELRKELETIIHSNDDRKKIIQRQSLRVTHYEIIHIGHTFHVIWDHKRQEIVTFLPSEDDGTISI